MPQAVGIILTAAGEEAQVDYGVGSDGARPAERKIPPHATVRADSGLQPQVGTSARRSSSQIWAELHEKAFRRLGGSPRIVVLDNLREVVIVADIYDRTLNPLFRDVLAHYGVVAMPCRIKDPDRTRPPLAAFDLTTEGVILSSLINP